MSRSRIALACKAVVTLGLLSWLLSTVDFASVSERIANGHAGLLVLAVMLLMVNIATVAARWWFLLRYVRPEPVALWFACKCNFAATFLGHVLPGAIGVDAVRAWLVYREGGRPGDAVTSVIADRAIALLGLVIVCGAGLAMAWPEFGAGTSTEIAVVGAVLGCAIVGGALAGPFVVDLMARAWSPLRHLARPARLISRVLFVPAGAIAFFLSCAVHLTTTSAVVIAAYALDAGVNPLGAIVVVPVSILVSLLPISIGGWGVREAGLAFGLTRFGMAAPDAALVSLLLGAGLIVASLPGAAAVIQMKLLPDIRGFRFPWVKQELGARQELRAKQEPDR